MIPVEFFVAGRPAPQGSKRAYKTKSGHVNVVESSKKVRPWRDAVRSETAPRFAAPLAGPVWVTVNFYLPRPAGHYGTGRNAAQLRPAAPARPTGAVDDVDKLLRAVLDGLKDGGAYKDDGQVVTVTARKYYAKGAPGAEITVRELGETQ